MNKVLRQFALVFCLIAIYSMNLSAQQKPGDRGDSSPSSPVYENRGYFPTSGAGLTVNLSAGSSLCGNKESVVDYPGGSLPLADQATNFVFLDPSSGCRPASNTKGFKEEGIPIAKVQTLGGDITTVTDEREWSADPQAGGSSDRMSMKSVNNFRFADQFSGNSGSEKQDAAISDVGEGPGVVIAVPGTGKGSPSRYSNSVPVLDFRQASDVVGRSTTDPDRPPVVLLENHLGDFTTKPLTGSVSVSRGSTELRGSGTHFMTELAHHLGRSVKLNNDNSSAWDEVASVSSDTQATLRFPYPGNGGSGAASYFITELGLAIRNTVTGGTPNTLNGGESVGLVVVSHRDGGQRGLYGANFNVNYNTPSSRNQGQALGLEIDLNNNSGTDDTVGATTYGLDLLSAGTNHPNTGILVTSGNPRSAWLRGALIAGWSQVGMFVQGSQDHLRFFTGAPPNGNPQIGGRNANDSAYIWTINNDGSAAFSVVTLHATTVGSLPPPSGGNTGAMVRVSDSTQVASEGQRCQGGSSHTALAFSDGTQWKCF